MTSVNGCFALTMLIALGTALATPAAEGSSQQCQGESCAAQNEEDSAMVQANVRHHNEHVSDKCENSHSKVCHAPFVLCAEAKCIVSSFSGSAHNTATCNCSYMGDTTSGAAKWTSSNPAPFTNKPFHDVCEFMKELPSRGYVLSTFTGVDQQKNWEFPTEESASYTCASSQTVTAQCDGAVCQVMDAATWTPKETSKWRKGDPAVCTCPTITGANQTIAGRLKDGKCDPALGPGYPGIGCVPKIDGTDTYNVMVGAVSGGLQMLNKLIHHCTGEKPAGNTYCNAP